MVNRVKIRYLPQNTRASDLYFADNLIHWDRRKILKRLLEEDKSKAKHLADTAAVPAADTAKNTENHKWTRSPSSDNKS